MANDAAKKPITIAQTANSNMVSFIVTGRVVPASEIGGFLPVIASELRADKG